MPTNKRKEDDLHRTGKAPGQMYFLKKVKVILVL